MRRGAEKAVLEMAEGGYVSLSVLSRSWGINPKAAHNYMRRGRLDGCVYRKDVNMWFAPSGAERPKREPRLLQVRGNFREGRVDPVPLGEWAQWRAPSPSLRSYGWFGVSA